MSDDRRKRIEELAETDPAEAARLTSLVAVAEDLVPESGLVGLYFLALGDDQPGWQGVITESLGHGYFLAQLFSWIDGSPSAGRVVLMRDMSGWEFYWDDENWREEAHRRGAVSMLSPPQDTNPQ